MQRAADSISATQAEATGVREVECLNTAQIDQLMALYQGEFWCAERRREDVERMLAHTDLVIALVDESDDTLIAFARVITDFVYKAMLNDVIVRTDRRGSGLGEVLLDRAVNHPRLREVDYIDLFCRPEMIPFYRRWGFSEDMGALLMMRRGKGE
ncbi:hypothetical protein BI364_16575 [Acidihalobacter yilgarnensis]|uniref:N-acetyltransferase domain-containing protein n=1 Tax=Acidihalobacter yilgarnensis TaxID=2819280 RepID=A0A1D8IS16_9GAMM|nr:GNAT family N-acetyltransferase [Acidihalobacter yilgarnensis]AOU99328.1 hypothetical protein BI364_16575 [Acidihalobacter yilgarnensis]